MMQTQETPHGLPSGGIRKSDRENGPDITAFAGEAEAVLNHSFRFSVIKNSRDTLPRLVKTTWGEFLTGWLAEAEERGDMPLDEYLAADNETRSRIKNGRAWIPALFKKDASRKDADVMGMTAAVLDFDDGAISFEDVEPRLAGLTFAVHSSFSHTPQKPKLRVIVPFAKVAAPALALPIFEHFNALFDGHCDPARKNPSGLYYLPACPYDAGDLYRQISRVGALFDPATIRTDRAQASRRAKRGGRRDKDWRGRAQ
jgi:hypothetical protein